MSQNFQFSPCKLPALLSGLLTYFACSCEGITVPLTPLVLPSLSLLVLARGPAPDPVICPRPLLVFFLTCPPLLLTCMPQ